MQTKVYKKRSNENFFAEISTIFFLTLMAFGLSCLASLNNSGDSDPGSRSEMEFSKMILKAARACFNSVVESAILKMKYFLENYQKKKKMAVECILSVISFN